MPLRFSSCNVCESVQTPPSTRPVLVVDDDAEIRDLLQEFLEFEGFQVASARNGREAMDALRREPACVILLDLMMPVMNGWQFRAAQQNDPNISDIPVVVISAISARAAPPIDAREYLQKPLDLDRLIDVVRACC